MHSSSFSSSDDFDESPTLPNLNRDLWNGGSSNIHTGTVPGNPSANPPLATPSDALLPSNGFSYGNGNGIIGHGMAGTGHSENRILDDGMISDSSAGDEIAHARTYSLNSMTRFKQITDVEYHKNKLYEV